MSMVSGMSCVLCSKPSIDGRKLCDSCENERLAAASAARVFSGSGLTWSNAEEYSEANWIRAAQARVSTPMSDCAVCQLIAKAKVDPCLGVRAALVVGTALGKSERSEIQLCAECEAELLVLVRLHNQSVEERVAS